MKTKIILSAILILPIIGTILAIETFQTSSKQVQTALANEIGKVAAAKTVKVVDVTKEFPIIPSAEISSVTSSNNRISLTLESTKSIEEIETFYIDYFFMNGWELVDGKYKKENKSLTVEISENIIKLTLNK